MTNKYDIIWQGVLLYWSDIEIYYVSVEDHIVYLYLCWKFRKKYYMCKGKRVSEMVWRCNWY